MTLGMRILLLFVATIAVSVSFEMSVSAQESIRVKEAVAPVFPVMAIAALKEGRTKVEVVISEDGTVKSIGSIESPEILRRTVDAVAKQWRFNPVRSGLGDRRAFLVFVFTLVPADTVSDKLLPIYRPPYEVEVKGRIPTISKDAQTIEKPRSQNQP